MTKYQRETHWFFSRFDEAITFFWLGVATILALYEKQHEDEALQNWLLAGFALMCTILGTWVRFH